MNEMLQRFSMNAIQQNPNINRNDPTTQTIMQIIQNGDSQQGAQLAQNICNSMGISVNEGLNRAAQSLGPQVNGFFGGK